MPLPRARLRNPIKCTGKENYTRTCDLSIFGEGQGGVGCYPSGFQQQVSLIVTIDRVRGADGSAGRITPRTRQGQPVKERRIIADVGRMMATGGWSVFGHDMI